MSDAPNTVSYLLTAGLTYAGTLVTAWATLFRNVKGDIAHAKEAGASQVGLDAAEAQIGRVQKESNDKHADLERRLSIAETRIENLSKENVELKGKNERLQERMAHFATDEELATLSNRQADQFNGLTERLGRVIGSLEQWGRQ